MAYPQTAAPTASTSTGVTSHPVTMPATVNAGDLLIVLFGSLSRVISAPGGWNLLSTAANNYELNVYYKIAAGTEGGTSPAWTSTIANNTSHQVYRITAWHGTTPPEVGTSALGNSANPNPPTLTPSWGSAETLWLAVSSGGYNGSPTISSYPTNYLNGVATVGGGGSQVSLLGSARRELTATSDDPGTFTTSGAAEWVAQTVAIRPAIPAATGTVASTQAAQIMAASGTNTPPVVPPSSGGNRMGGTGAIRKPPR